MLFSVDTVLYSRSLALIHFTFISGLLALSIAFPYFPFSLKFLVTTIPALCRYGNDCLQSERGCSFVKELPSSWGAAETLTTGRSQVESSAWRTELCCIWFGEEIRCQDMSVFITVCDQKIQSCDFCISPQSALWHLHLVPGSFKAEPQGPAFLQ